MTIPLTTILTSPTFSGRLVVGPRPPAWTVSVWPRSLGRVCRSAIASAAASRRAHLRAATLRSSW
eukprot:15443760-Alexandrium_andersonii.AAC.1